MRPIQDKEGSNRVRLLKHRFMVDHIQHVVALTGQDANAASWEGKRGVGRKENLQD